jgi:hypothetical protein
MGLQRARVALAGRDLRFEALQPPAGDGVEAQARRGRHPAGRQRADQLLAGPPGAGEIAAGGAEMKAAGAPGADREVAVGLAVDAALDSGAARPAC